MERWTGSRNIWMEARRFVLSSRKQEVALMVGIMFYAMLAFPSTPSHSQGNVNPFDMLSPPIPTNAASAFALPSADTDLCLSLESMRGRKYLQVRGLTPLPEDEVLEGDTDEAGVQM
jgi:hypothetical protein